MMGSIWLAWCGSDDMASVRQEICGRDAGSQLVRCDGPDVMLAMRDLLSPDAGGVAICPHGATEEAEDLIGAFARHGGAASIVAMVDELDAGVAARMFYAGATEVVQAPRAREPPRIVGAEEGRSSRASRARSAAARGDQGVPPWPRRPGAAGPTAGDVIPMRAVLGAAGAERDKAAEALSSRSDDGAGCADAAGTAVPVEPKRTETVLEVLASSVPAAARAEQVRDGADAPDGGAGRHEADPSAPEGRRAPLVTLISGRGGVGKTTIAASMAWMAAHMGLKAALIDLDLMFGNLHDLMGIEEAVDLCGITGDHDASFAGAQSVEATAMRVAPGLTLWGPCREPEKAELVSSATEDLIEVLRAEADVVFVDTSVFWGDAAASAVSRCDRCLVVGTGGASGEASAQRAVGLAARIGVPKTRMTCVFNRFGARGCGEERALRFEMAVALRSRVRISDGGEPTAELLEFGRLGDALIAPGAFGKSVKSFACTLLRELGCPIQGWDAGRGSAGEQEAERPRLRLPWKREGAMAR